MTEQPLYDPRLLIWSVVCGAFLSLCYDCLRARRIIFAPPHDSSVLGYIDAVAVFFGDVLFGALSAVTVILLTFKFNDGKLRWFVFAGLGVGFILCRLTLSALLKSIIVAAAKPGRRFAAYLRKRCRLAARVRRSQRECDALIALAGRGFARECVKKHGDSGNACP